MMDFEDLGVERRKNKRFKLKESAYAVMGYNPSKMGHISDISRGGLAIRYTNNGQGSKTSYELDIFKPDFSFYMDHIKTEAVWDLELVGRNIEQCKATRRCGLQYKNLTVNQMSQLENFIQNHAIIYENKHPTPEGPVFMQPHCAEKARTQFSTPPAILPDKIL